MLGANAGYSAGRSITDTVFNDPAIGEPAVRADQHRPVRRRDLRRAGRLQLGQRLWLAGIEGDLQYPSRARAMPRSAPATSAIRGWLRSTRRSPRPSSRARMVRHPARAPRHHDHAGCAGLCHRWRGRSATSRPPARLSGFDVERHRRQHRLQQPGRPGSAGPSASGSRLIWSATGPASSNISTWISARSRSLRLRRRTRPSRGSSIPASRTTSCGLGINYKSDRSAAIMAKY